MVSHRLRSISSVFGGKNSKEIAGDFRRGGLIGAAGRNLGHGTTNSTAHRTGRLSAV